MSHASCSLRPAPVSVFCSVRVSQLELLLSGLHIYKRTYGCGERQAKRTDFLYKIRNLGLGLTVNQRGQNILITLCVVFSPCFLADELNFHDSTPQARQGRGSKQACHTVTGNPFPSFFPIFSMLPEQLSCPSCWTPPDPALPAVTRLGGCCLAQRSSKAKESPVLLCQTQLAAQQHC